MKNNKEFTAEQMLQINKMLNKANFEMNRSENKSANICRIAEKEIWKNLGEIVGFEEYNNYEVSNFGRVKSLDFIHSGKERILKLSKRPDGYLRVCFTANGKHKHFSINRIVAAAFCENDDTENKTITNHKNHRKSDNFYKNLEWVSHKENTQAFFDYDLEKVAERSMKISEALSGENNPNFGKKLSDETRKKISEAKQNISDETRKKLSDAMKGKKHSDETRKKMSEALKGKKLSDETRKKISEANSGENHPMFGKKHSDETRKKMSDAKKLRFSKSKAS